MCIYKQMMEWRIGLSVFGVSGYYNCSFFLRILWTAMIMAFSGMKAACEVLKAFNGWCITLKEWTGFIIVLLCERLQLHVCMQITVDCSDANQSNDEVQRTKSNNMKLNSNFKVTSLVNQENVKRLEWPQVPLIPKNTTI